MFERPGKLLDPLPRPYKNEETDCAATMVPIYLTLVCGYILEYGNEYQKSEMKKMPLLGNENDLSKTKRSSMN